MDRIVVSRAQNRPQPWRTSGGFPKLSDIALFFLAFIGVTGYLPLSVITGVESFREIAAKIAGIGK
jgi:hypothetical protein